MLKTDKGRESGERENGRKRLKKSFLVEFTEGTLYCMK
jgi:hypothetical protein